MSPPALLLRADAGAGPGMGHLSRLLALAGSWTASGARAAIVTASPSGWARARAAEAGAAVLETPGSHPDGVDLSALRAAISEAGAAPWVAVDGYGFDAAYLAAVRSAGGRVLAVDDWARLKEYPVDVLLDQNAGSESREYPLPSGALPLQGPRWALLRPAFAEVGARRKLRARAARVLISFGGADPGDAAGTAVRALRRLKLPFEAVVALGPDDPREAALAASAKGLPVRVESGADMAALMAWADVALIGGGVTTLEACAAGLPALVATVAANQESAAGELSRRGAVRLLGKAAELDEASMAAALADLLADRAAREGLSRAGRRNVDGRGAARVVEVLRALSAASLPRPKVRLRPARPEDALDVWRINNDPGVRERSFSKAPIPLEAHLSWYAARLKDPDYRIWVLEAGGAVAAQVRYSRSGDGAMVHCAVHGAFRGKGLGTLALSSSRGPACRGLGVRRLWGAMIIPNPASERSLLSAGWSKRGVERFRGEDCAIFEWICS